jgi:hypothetical protein
VARATFRLTAPRVPELPLHQQIADVLRLELAPPGKVSRAGVVWWSCDIAAYEGTTPGLRTSRGVIAGVPDIFVLHRGIAHHIEVKAEDGVVSLEQQSVATAILVARGRWGVARDSDEALALLDAWGIPRTRRTQVAA